MANIAGNLQEVILDGVAVHMRQYPELYKSTTPGPEGQKGAKGDQGISVHHIKGTSTTDLEGDFGSHGETDTYTLYGDYDETINLGHFSVSNGIDGKDSYEYAAAAGYLGAEAEFYEEIRQVRVFRDQAQLAATQSTDSADAAEASATSITNLFTPINVKSYYESNTNTNAYTDAEKSKLTGIESGAQVNVPETVTNLNIVGNELRYVNESGITQSIDLSLYLDDTNLSRIINGTYDAGTQSLVFTRDDNSTFSIDASMFFDDTNLVTSVAGKTGAVTLVKADVGLANVDNTSDLNKPISTATQAALDLKANLDTATVTTNGLMAFGDKSKLDGIEENATGDMTGAEIKALYEAQTDKTLDNVTKVDLGDGSGPGTVVWNTGEHTLDVTLNSTTVLQVGQEMVVPVRNTTGNTITNGTVVMATGTVGASGRITVDEHDGTKANAMFVLGLATANMLAGEDGLVTSYGKVRGLNTTGSTVGESWAEGDVLYVKPNDNGKLTKVKPAADELSMPIAMVLYRHTSVGLLEVRVNGVDENRLATAGAIAVSPQGNLSSNTVQSALVELQADVDSMLVDKEW